MNKSTCDPFLLHIQQTVVVRAPPLQSSVAKLLSFFINDGYHTIQYCASQDNNYSLAKPSCDFIFEERQRDERLQRTAEMGVLRGCELTVSYIAHSVFRFIQLVLALAVCGLYGVDLSAAHKQHKYADGKWVRLLPPPPISPLLPSNV